MKKTLLALAVAAALVPSLAMAEAGDIVVRLRATHIAPDESSKLGAQTDASYTPGTTTESTALYGNPGATLGVDSNTIPEIDFSYYITKNIAAELILAVGTRHDVHINGLNGGAVTQSALGSVNLLPPTLTAQWHFNPDQTFDPYVGAGLSYVRAMDNGLTAVTPAVGSGTQPIRISRNSFGPAIQAGVDYNLPDSKWLVNFDVKKIWFSSDVELNVNNGGWKKIDSLDVDPWVVSVGFGRKF
jgi:outer membrane protein